MSFEPYPSSVIDALQPESGSDFELTALDASDEFDATPRSPSDSDVTAAEPSTSGINLGRPSDSGINLSGVGGFDFSSAESIELAPLDDDEPKAPPKKAPAKPAAAKKPDLSGETALPIKGSALDPSATALPIKSKGGKDIFEDTRAIAEPSGAVSLAGLKAYAAREAKRTGALIAINSGANMNFDRLRHIAERAEIGEHREALLAVTIPERPGAYRAFIELLGRRAITEFNYRYSDPKAARIFAFMALSRPTGNMISATSVRSQLVMYTGPWKRSVPPSDIAGRLSR